MYQQESHELPNQMPGAAPGQEAVLQRDRAMFACLTGAHLREGTGWPWQTQAECEQAVRAAEMVSSLLETIHQCAART